MSWTLQAALQMVLDVVEIADSTTSPGSNDAGNRRVYDQYSQRINLHSLTGSYPEVGNRVVDLSYTLGGTTQDVDLAAAKWAGNVATTIDLTGKKLVALLLNFAKTNNAAGIDFGGHGANAYGLFGTTTKPKFYPGMSFSLGNFDAAQNGTSFSLALPAVAAGAKDLRFVGTAADVITGLAIFSE